jgi:hypothetical protein
VWKAILNPKAKADLMESLLEKSPANKALGAEFDAIISEFRSVSKIRNDYVHGLWWTSDGDGSLWLAKPKDDDHGLTLFAASKEDPDLIAAATERIKQLERRCILTSVVVLEARRAERARQASGG